MKGGVNNVFRKSGYDPFVDFIKSYCIICVVLAHALPKHVLSESLYVFWGGMQVPMFLLIQVFHFFKRDNIEDYCKKILIRLVMPFVGTQIVLYLYLLLYAQRNATELCSALVHGGGLGPGSYYCVVSIQMAFLLSLVKPLFDKYSMRMLLLFFVLLCVGIDVVLSYVVIPGWCYRLLATRYVFLVFLGVIWVRKGFPVSKTTVILSLISILMIFVFEYSNKNLEPVFCSTDWKTHRWICYFYVAFALTWMLRWLYNKVRANHLLISLFKKTAKSSYEIYLVQMGVFVIPNPLCVKLNLPFYVGVVFNVTLCLLLGYFLERYVISPTQRFLFARF